MTLHQFCQIPLHPFSILMFLARNGMDSSFVTMTKWSNSHNRVLLLQRHLLPPPLIQQLISTWSFVFLRQSRHQDLSVSLRHCRNHKKSPKLRQPERRVTTKHQNLKYTLRRKRLSPPEMLEGCSVLRLVRKTCTRSSHFQDFVLASMKVTATNLSA